MNSNEEEREREKGANVVQSSVVFIDHAELSTFGIDVKSNLWPETWKYFIYVCIYWPGARNAGAGAGARAMAFLVYEINCYDEKEFCVAESIVRVWLWLWLYDSDSDSASDCGFGSGFGFASKLLLWLSRPRQYVYSVTATDRDSGMINNQQAISIYSCGS